MIKDNASTKHKESANSNDVGSRLSWSNLSGQAAEWTGQNDLTDVVDSVMRKKDSGDTVGGTEAASQELQENRRGTKSRNWQHQER